MAAQGPLKGLKIVEMAGIGPGPFIGMVFSDMGADVVRIDRKGTVKGRDSEHFKQDHTNVTARGRRSVAVDLKNPAGVETVLKLIDKADALIDVFRPGVMERLGLGPDVCLKRNPRLVYGRMTGWGQEGPLSKAAGHDINYISINGILHAIGPRKGPPTPPLNLVGDYAGALGLCFGIAAGVIEARASGKGQVVDAAMCDIASLLMAQMWGMRAKGGFNDKERESNMLDGGAYFYGAYETKDGKYISIASIESQFYAELIERCQIKDPDWKEQWNKANWSKLKEKATVLFKTKTREEWCKILEGSDVCFGPVLTMTEALAYPHNTKRNAFVEVSGVAQPAPAPRFLRTPGKVQGPPPANGEHNESALADWGIAKAEIAKLKAAGAI
jgi:alpha-methylacyl-CoA racemase